MTNRPLFLRDYDFISALNAWAGAADAEKRHWTISLFRGNLIKCQLSWRGVGGSFEGQMCFSEYVAESAQEAVFNAIRKESQR